MKMLFEKEIQESFEKYALDCLSYEKIKYAGMVCKHIYLANELFGQKYRQNQSVSPQPIPKENVVPDKLDIQSTETYFSYGTQKLNKRAKKAIPSYLQG